MRQTRRSDAVPTPRDLTAEGEARRDVDDDDDDDEHTSLTPRILLVDPRGDVLDLLKAHLPADAQISSTDSVQRAMPRIDNEPFDLVVCDIDTQGMEQLLAGAARVAFLQGARIVALNGVRAPTTTSQPDLKRVLAHALNAG